MSERKRANPRNVNTETGKDMGTKIIGRPEGANLKSEKRDVETKELFFMTPSGKNCKKVYEVYYTKTGKHKRLLRIEKGVKF